MKEEIRKGKNDFDVVITVGIIGHCPLEKLNELKQAVEQIDGFGMVFFKTSSGRLWIKEGDHE